MNNLYRMVGVIGLAALGMVGTASGPAVSFELGSGSPSAGSVVAFADTSSRAATSWSWSFGDGAVSTLASPTHVYAAAGFYPVTLRATDASGTSETTMTIEVLPSSTLRLLALSGHAFDATLEWADPATGASGSGQAVPQSDAFGYFTVPSGTPGAAAAPEVFVKMQDARPIGGDYWVFSGGLTDLTYVLTVRDTVTGATKVKRCSAADRAACMDRDTTGFLQAAAAHVVNVGQGGNQFVDMTGGGKQTTIHVGETVQWNWVAASHSTTSGACKGGGGAYGGGATCTESNVWSSGAHSPPFQYSYTFMTAGTYTYFCGIHGDAMTGSVVVTADSPAVTPTVTVTPQVGTVAPRQLDNVVSKERTLETHTVVGRPAPTGAPPANTPTPTATSGPQTPTPTLTPTPTPTPPASSQTVLVDVLDFRFRDHASSTSTTRINAGDKVEWQFQNGTHSTTSGPCPPCAGDGVWGSSIKSSGTFDHTFAEADRGKTFPYFCVVHTTMMTGMVIVNP